MPLVRKYWPIIISLGNKCLAVANLRVGSDVQIEQGYLPVHRKLVGYMAKSKATNFKFRKY